MYILCIHTCVRCTYNSMQCDAMRCNAIHTIQYKSISKCESNIITNANAISLHCECNAITSANAIQLQMQMQYNCTCNTSTNANAHTTVCTTQNKFAQRKIIIQISRSVFRRCVFLGRGLPAHCSQFQEDVGLRCRMTKERARSKRTADG